MKINLHLEEKYVNDKKKETSFSWKEEKYRT